MNQRSDDAATVHITTLSVTGIRCGGCAAYIRQMLEGVSGVVHVDVHHRRNEIIVEHLPAFVGSDAIAAAIRTIGYGAEVSRTVPEVECARPAPNEHILSSCSCSRQVEYDRSFNLGTSTIG